MTVMVGAVAVAAVVGVAVVAVVAVAAVADLPPPQTRAVAHKMAQGRGPSLCPHTATRGVPVRFHR